MFEEGSLPEVAYKLVKDQEYCGEIKVSLTFTAEVMLESVFLLFFLHALMPTFSLFKYIMNYWMQRNGDLGYNAEEETYGGWNQSAREF